MKISNKVEVYHEGGRNNCFYFIEFAKRDLLCLWWYRVVYVQYSRQWVFVSSQVVKVVVHWTLISRLGGELICPKKVAYLAGQCRPPTASSILLLVETSKVVGVGVPRVQPRVILTNSWNSNFQSREYYADSRRLTLIFYTGIGFISC